MNNIEKVYALSIKNEDTEALANYCNKINQIFREGNVPILFLPIPEDMVNVELIWEAKNDNS